VRTTVTLDPDTADLLRREIARSHVSFKQAINDAIRRGIAGTQRGKPEAASVLGFRSDYRSGVDRLRLQQLADDMETDAALARTARLE